MSTRPFNPDSDPRQLAIDLLVTSARFTRLAARETPTAVPPALWRVLAELEEFGPIRVGDLAAADRVSQPTATAAVQKLVERGWVERSTQHGDRRAVQVSLTPAGRRVLYQTRQAVADALLPRLVALDPGTLRALAAGVEAVGRVLAADEPTDSWEGHRPK